MTEGEEVETSSLIGGVDEVVVVIGVSISVSMILSVDSSFAASDKKKKNIKN